MPYKDPMKAREWARRRRERVRAAKIASGWVDGRGRHDNHVRGASHPRWNDGIMTNSHGYVLVRVPEDHHLRCRDGYAREHQLVAEEMLGRRLRAGELVHHKNDNKADNRPENLEVKTRSEHARLHCQRLWDSGVFSYNKEGA